MELTELDLYGGPLDGLTFNCPTQLVDGIVTVEIQILKTEGITEKATYEKFTHTAIYIKNPETNVLHYKETNEGNTTGLSQYDNLQPRHRRPGAN